MTKPILELANEAVVNKLKLDSEKNNNQDKKTAPFIERHKKEIYNKLIHFYEEDAKCRTEQGCEIVFFITESLPLINGIIHVGSTVEDFREAIKWAKTSKDFRDDADPSSVLLALTFIYILNKGEKDNPQIDEFRKMREMVIPMLRSAGEGKSRLTNGISIEPRYV